MKTKITLLFLFVSMTLLAQKKYRVVYDYQTENISYYEMKDNKVVDTLSKPKLKRKSIVELKLKNINPFALDVITDIKEESAITEGQGMNFSSLVGSLKTFSDERLNIDIENPSTDSIFTKSRGAVNTHVSEVNKLIANISATKNTLKYNLLNPNLNKEKILENIMDASTNMKFADSKDPNKNFYLFLSTLKQSVIKNTNKVSNEITDLANAIEATPTSRALSRGELVDRNYNIKYLQKKLQAINDSKEKSIDDINELESLYMMLEASNFERTYDYIIEADRVNIELKFVQSEFSDKSDVDNNQSTLKVRNIKLFSKGGFKINTSVALTLNNFGSKSNDFFKKDSLIGADKNTHYIPNISTMINFYPYAGENFNVGGSFGVSIPISGTDNINGINYILGPTLFFGSKSRLALSGGIAYGPVKVLKNGFKVGDLAPEEDLKNFTKTVYDFGYYFGLSFNLFNVK